MPVAPHGLQLLGWTPVTWTQRGYAAHLAGQEVQDVRQKSLAGDVMQTIEVGGGGECVHPSGTGEQLTADCDLSSAWWLKAHRHKLNYMTLLC